MPRLSLGLGVSSSSKLPSGGAAPITTSRAFNSSNVQVGSTNTGDIPANWVDSESTVTSVIFANDNSVTSIGNYAFNGCTSLTSITIPNSVTSIGDSSFKDCMSLATATIGNSVTSIGSYAFDGCTNLTSITIPPSLTSIGSYAFKNSGFTTINIPNTVTSIGEDAFKNSTSLTTATIGTGVTSVADYAFDGCTSLATVSCYVAQSVLNSGGAYYIFRGTASPLVIQARITDASWTVGTGLTFQGNTNVTVIKNL